MIFQENNLFPWLTTRQNVGFGLAYSTMSKAQRHAALDAMLGKVGLNDAAARYPRELSGGMRQRAAIARALVTEPKVLLLDEPFSTLDTTMRRRMQDLLRGIWKETRTTFVMVTHNIEEAILVGDRVIVLGGRPASVLLDRSIADDFRDRYGSAFLALQREIEGLIE